MTSSTTQGIQIVLHPVTDLAKSKPVYTALLGLDPQADAPYYVGFEAEGQQIGLVPGGGPQAMTSPVAYWHVADIEAKLAEVTAAGASLNEPRARRRRRPPRGHGHRPRRQRPRDVPGSVAPTGRDRAPEPARTPGSMAVRIEPGVAGRDPRRTGDEQMETP